MIDSPRENSHVFGNIVLGASAGAGLTAVLTSKGDVGLVNSLGDATDKFVREATALKNKDLKQENKNILKALKLALKDGVDTLDDNSKAIIENVVGTTTNVKNETLTKHIDSISENIAVMVKKNLEYAELANNHKNPSDAAHKTARDTFQRICDYTNKTKDQIKDFSVDEAASAHKFFKRTVSATRTKMIATFAILGAFAMASLNLLKKNMSDSDD